MELISVPHLMGNERSQDIEAWISTLTEKTELFLNKDLTLHGDLTFNSNVNIKVINGGRVITNGHQVVFEGTVDSDNDEWIEASPDNPPIFKKRSEIRVDEFVRDTCDRNRIQCAINSASKSNHCEVKLQVGKHYFLDGSIYIHHDINNPGFDNTANGQARIAIRGDGTYADWVELNAGEAKGTILEFTNTTGDCIIGDLTEHESISKYQLRDFQLGGFNLICNTPGRAIYFNIICENIIIERITVWNKHIDGDGVFINKGWNYDLSNMLICGDRFREQEGHTLNTGIGLHIIPGEASVGGGLQRLVKIVSDGWKYGMILGACRYPDVDDVHGAMNVAVNVTSCCAQTCDTGLYVGGGWRSVKFTNFYAEACRDMLVDLDNGCSEISFDTCYFYAPSNLSTCNMRIGHVESGGITYNNAVYNIFLENCKFSGIRSRPAITRKPPEIYRNTGYTEINCSFIGTNGYSNQIARDFRDSSGISTYLGPCFITGASYSSANDWIDEPNHSYGTRYTPLTVNTDHVKAGRPIIESGFFTNIVDNEIQHHNKGNWVVVGGTDIVNNITPTIEGMSLYIRAGSLSGFSVAHATSGQTDKNIRTRTGQNFHIPYGAVVLFKCFEINNTLKWIQEGVEILPDPVPEIQYFTNPTDGHLNWNGKTNILGLDGTTDITSIGNFVGGAEVTLFCRNVNGVTIKHNSGSNNHKIITKSFSDVTLKYHKTMKLVAINDGSWEYWVEEGYSPMPVQPKSTATNIETLKNDFNFLLAKLKAAKLMETS